MHKSNKPVSYGVVETALDVMAERRKDLEAAPNDLEAKRRLVTAIDNVNGLLERLVDKGERTSAGPFSWEYENKI